MCPVRHERNTLLLTRVSRISNAHQLPQASMRIPSTVVFRAARGAMRACAAVGAWVISSTAGAQVTLPPMNLGASSFADGVGGPGFLVQPMMLEIYRATRFTDRTGRTMPGNNSIDAWSNLFHVAYMTSRHVFGGFYAVDFLLPVARLNVNTGFGPHGTETGVGDMIVSPLTIEWPNRTMAGRPFFSRASVLARIPTGAYSPERTVNAGTNAVGAVGYYAFTLFLRPDLETSWRLQYMWNGRNPAPFTPLAAGSTQAGQAFHANYAMSYRISSALGLGINGYYLQQVTDHRLDGNPIPGSRERVVAVGPGAVISHGFWSLLANVDVESNVRNRPAGYRVNATVQRVFPSAAPPVR
jgi:hypothetical protein